MRNEHMNILSRANELHCGLSSSGVVSWDRSGTLQASWLILATTNEQICLCSKIIQDILVQTTGLDIKITISKMFHSHTTIFWPSFNGNTKTKQQHWKYHQQATFVAENVSVFYTKHPSDDRNWINTSIYSALGVAWQLEPITVVPHEVRVTPRTSHQLITGSIHNHKQPFALCTVCPVVWCVCLRRRSSKQIHTSKPGLIIWTPNQDWTCKNLAMR